MPETPKPRTRRSPAERAQAEYDATKARVTRAEKALVEAEVAHDSAKAEYNRALQLSRYAEMHPDLPAPDPFQSGA